MAYARTVPAGQPTRRLLGQPDRGPLRHHRGSSRSPTPTAPSTRFRPASLCSGLIEVIWWGRAVEPTSSSASRWHWHRWPDRTVPLCRPAAGGLVPRRGRAGAGGWRLPCFPFGGRWAPRCRPGLRDVRSATTSPSGCRGRRGPRTRCCARSTPGCRARPPTAANSDLIRWFLNHPVRFALIFCLLSLSFLLHLTTGPLFHFFRITLRGRRIPRNGTGGIRFTFARHDECDDRVQQKQPDSGVVENQESERHRSFPRIVGFSEDLSGRLGGGEHFVDQRLVESRVDQAVRQPEHLSALDEAAQLFG